MFAYKNWHPFSSPTWKSEAACRLCQRPRNFRAVPAPPKLDKKTTRTTATSNNHDHNHNHNHGHQQQQRQRRLMHELQNVFVVSQVPAERAQILAEVATKMQKHSQASKKCPMTHCHSGQMLFVCLTLSFLSTIKLVVSFMDHGLFPSPVSPLPLKRGSQFITSKSRKDCRIAARSSNSWPSGRDMKRQGFCSISSKPKSKISWRFSIINI